MVVIMVVVGVRPRHRVRPKAPRAVVGVVPGALVVRGAQVLTLDLVSRFGQHRDVAMTRVEIRLGERK